MADVIIFKLVSKGFFYHAQAYPFLFIFLFLLTNHAMAYAHQHCVYYLNINMIKNACKTYKVIGLLLYRHVVELIIEIRIGFSESFFVQFLILHDRQLSPLLFIVPILEIVV